MKFISFRYVNRNTWGIYGPDGGVIDLGAEFITTIPTLRDYLTAARRHFMTQRSLGLGDCRHDQPAPAC